MCNIIGNLSPLLHIVSSILLPIDHYWKCICGNLIGNLILEAKLNDLTAFRMYHMSVVRSHNDCVVTTVNGWFISICTVRSKKRKQNYDLVWNSVKKVNIIQAKFKVKRKFKWSIPWKCTFHQLEFLLKLTGL